MTATNKRCKTELEEQAESIAEWAIGLKDLSGLSASSRKKLATDIVLDVLILRSYRTNTELSEKLRPNSIMLESYIDDASRLFVKIYGHTIASLGWRDTVKRTEDIYLFYNEFMQRLNIDVKYEKLLMERPLILECCINS